MRIPTILILFLFVATSFILYKQENTRELARVEKIDGKELYLFSEPLTPYKVVGDYNNSKNRISTCNLKNLVESFLERGKEDKIKFDALYMDTEDNIYLIQFIKEPSKE